jgi:homogentisate phytyltransferase / homogentisate geranylgeranyltransferase
MKTLHTLWQFSRPHTIIGSFFSITALFILAGRETGWQPYWWLYAVTLASALACNVFIVGLNQIADIELDKINKPWLPLAAGVWTKKQGRDVISIALVICLALSFVAGSWLPVLMGVILLIGMAYSLPPLQLKKHHLPAAIAITLVRGVLVNVGFYIFFRQKMTGETGLVQTGSVWMPGAIICLTLFIMAFSVAIAWFKDLPDTEGDAQFKIKTLALLYSKKNALWGGTILVGAAYVYSLYWAAFKAVSGKNILLIGHAVLFLFFILNFISVKLADAASVKKFYMRFWVFFFAEYLLFMVWALGSGE